MQCLVAFYMGGSTYELADFRIGKELGEDEDVPEVELVGYFGSPLLAQLWPLLVYLDVDGD